MLKLLVILITESGELQEQVQGRMEGKEIGDNRYRRLFQGAVAERDVGQMSF